MDPVAEEQCLQALLAVGYPEDRIVSGGRMCGYVADFVILAPGFAQFPMAVIEVKEDAARAVEWLNHKSKQIQLPHGCRAYAYAGAEKMFLSDFGTHAQNFAPPYKEVLEGWLAREHCISSLRLENFMAFGHAEFQFSPKLNVIIGDNGSGKTQLVKLLYAFVRNIRLVQGNLAVGKGFEDELRGVFRIKDDLSQLTRRNGPPGAKGWKAVVGVSGLNPVEVGCDGFGVNGLGDNSDGEGLREYAALQQAVFMPARELLSVFPGFNSFSQIYKNKWPYDRTVTDCMAYLGALPIASQGKAAEHIVQSIEKLIGGHIYFDERKDCFMMQPADGGAAYPVDVVAEGWRKLGELVQLVLVGAIAPGGVLFWDEPEANLNPSLIRQVAEVVMALTDMGVQVFITTHSLFLMRELEYLGHVRKDDLAVWYMTLGAEGVGQSHHSFELRDIVSFEEEVKQEDRVLAVDEEDGTDGC